MGHFVRFEHSRHKILASEALDFDWLFMDVLLSKPKGKCELT